MQNLINALFIVCFHITAFSQSIGVGSNVFVPDASAGLEVNFSDKGILIPRVNLTSRNDATTIPSPAHSLLVYNTGAGGLSPKGYYYNKGTSVSPDWVMLIPDDTLKNFWSLLGNNGTNPSLNFVGTTDNADLVFRTNNQERVRIGSNGRIAVNTWLDWFQVEVKAERNWSGVRIRSDSNVQMVLQTNDNNLAIHAYYQNMLPRFSHGITNNGDWWILNRYNNSGNFEESVLYVNRNNGLVGIGSSPVHFKLDVYQKRNWGGIRVRSDSSTQIVIESGNNFWSQYAFVQGGVTRFTNNVTPNGNVWNITRFDNSGNAIDAVLNISRSTGYVGILVDNPNAALHVRPSIDAGPDTPDGLSSFMIGPANGSHLEMDDDEIHAMNGVNASNLYLNANGGNVYIGWPSGAEKLTVGSNGDGTSAIANAWNLYSDARKKTNIRPIQGALNKISQINGYYYYWLNSPDTSQQIGFLAQEIEKVFPEITVHGINDKGEDYYGVDYSKMTPVLVEALKELLLRIDRLEKEIENLKEENQNLKKLLEKK